MNFSMRKILSRDSLDFSVHFSNAYQIAHWALMRFSLNQYRHMLCSPSNRITLLHDRWDLKPRECGQDIIAQKALHHYYLTFIFLPEGNKTKNLIKLKLTLTISYPSILHYSYLTKRRDTEKFWHSVVTGCQLGLPFMLSGREQKNMQVTYATHGDTAKEKASTLQCRGCECTHEWDL